jgi:hypothetical protein
MENATKRSVRGFLSEFYANHFSLNSHPLCLDRLGFNTQIFFAMTLATTESEARQPGRIGKGIEDFTIGSMRTMISSVRFRDK